jgi:hypothetical protein
MELTMASFFMEIAEPDIGLLSFLVSIMVSMLRVVPLKKMWLSEEGNSGWLTLVTLSI